MTKHLKRAKIGKTLNFTDMNLSNKVFESSRVYDTLSDRVFYLILGIMVIIGLAVMGYAAQYAVQNQLVFTKWEIVLVGLVIPIIGILISLNSDNPLLSFIGYMMVAIPEGLVLGPVFVKYGTDLVMRAAWLTGGITLLMTMAAFIQPSFFAKLGGALFTALICLLVIRLIQMFVPALQELKLIDYCSAGIFSLYIGYDMYRAQNIDRTVDNAIDVAVALYLDILNLFLSILSSSKK